MRRFSPEFGKKLLSSVFLKTTNQRIGFFLGLLLVYNCVMLFNFKSIGFRTIIHQIGGYVANESPLIFLGGYPRSGTTLMRAILDVHPSVSCGPETIILPSFLGFISQRMSDRHFLTNFDKAHFNLSTLDRASAHFIYQIMLNHIRDAERLCAKDPDLALHMAYLHQLFPKAKFIYMVRDVRSATYSLLKHLNKTTSEQHLRKSVTDWNEFNTKAHSQCESIGPSVCQLVHYEELVRNTSHVLTRLVRFLDITWRDELLSHDKFVGEKVKVSETEWSTNQIRRKINTDSLANWNTSLLFRKSQTWIARLPMQVKFGYS